MPVPEKRPNETKDQFINRCMADKTMNAEFSNPNQRYAVCVNLAEKKQTNGK